jgi:BirA family biotin operon repressor/biotin-[acetyl-CoA-carboxylase] ligase
MLAADTLITDLLSFERVAIDYLRRKYSIETDCLQSLLEELKQKGFRIETDAESVHLLDIPDILYPEIVRYGLKSTLIGSHIIHYIETGSTNSEAMDLCRAGAVQEGTVIISEHQTAGRGRYNRIWEDTPSMSILCSIVLNPFFLRLNSLFSLTVIATLSIIEAVRESTGIELSVKWPNDIYFKERKIAGVLIETQSQSDRICWAVMGIGLNINQPEVFFSDITYPAVSLRVAAGKQLNRYQVCAKLLEHLDRSYEALKKGAYDQLFARWQAYCSSISRIILFNGPDGKSSGVIQAVMPDGGLSVVKQSGETVNVQNGEIQ